MEELKNALTNEEKSLLLHCINSYMEKTLFVMHNKKYYCVNDFVFRGLEDDMVLLKNLQLKIFSIDIKGKEEEEWNVKENLSLNK